MKPPLIAAIFDELPDAGQPFDPFARERWTAALVAVIEVAYPRHTSRPSAAAAAPAPATADAPAVPVADDRLLVACPDCGKQLKPGGLALHKIRKHPTVAAATAPDPPAVHDAAPPPGPARPWGPDVTVQGLGDHQCHICYLRTSSEEALRSHIHRTHNLDPIPAPPITRQGPIDQDAARARAAAAL